MKFIDLTGEKYGRWTVIERDCTKKGTKWLCECDCGNKKSINPTVLKNGHSKSCGCYWTDTMTKNRIDLIGRKFGKLLVINRIDKKGNWECLCDCGRTTVVYSPSLYSGASKSCGCLRAELLSGENSKFWKGGIADETRRIKHTPVFMKWPKLVRKRDRNICKKCGSNDKLHAHHIVNWAFDKTKALDLNNGITLCEKCHKLFHKNYGKKENNIEQLNEFLNEK